MTDPELADLGISTEPATFTHAELDRIEAIKRQLAEDPALEGYTPGYPTWGLITGHDLDIKIAATSTCNRCGRYGLGHAGFISADGSHSWRGFAICPSCGWSEEF